MTEVYFLPSHAQDGMVSAEEIAFVMQHVLTAASTPKEARAIAEEVRFTRKNVVVKLLTR